ncbi:MAG: tyrosine-type recombinase/integrase, partial [bacterium]
HLDEITTGHVETYLLRLYDTGRSPHKRNGEYAKIGARTVNRVRSCLKQILGEAVRLGYLKRNPVDPVFKFKEQPNPRGILSREELWALLFRPDAVSAVWDGDRVHYLFTLTGAITGARQGEIRALRGRHVHREFIEINHGWDDVLNQPTDAPKWGHRRVATVPEAVGDLLLGWIDEIGAGADGWVFPSPTDRAIPVTSYTVLKRFNAALARAGITAEHRKRRNLVFHSLRHSLVTAMRAGAVDSWQAQHAVGHRTDKMFDHYSDHITPEHLGDVRAFQRRLMQPPEDTRKNLS